MINQKVKDVQFFISIIGILSSDCDSFHEDVLFHFIFWGIGFIKILFRIFLIFTDRDFDHFSFFYFIAVYFLIRLFDFPFVFVVWIGGLFGLQGIVVPSMRKKWPGPGFTFHAWVSLDDHPVTTTVSADSSFIRRILYRYFPSAFLLIQIYWFMFFGLPYLPK